MSSSMINFTCTHLQAVTEHLDEVLLVDLCISLVNITVIPALPLVLLLYVMSFVDFPS